MTNPASWALLVLGVAGLALAAALACHFFRHRDRRRGDRRRGLRRGRSAAAIAASADRRERRDRRSAD